MPARLVIADPDEGYIRQYEEDLICAFGTRAQIQIITQPSYLENFFRTHQIIDILVIAREFYGAFVKEHEIGHMLVLDKYPRIDINGDNEFGFGTDKFTTKEELFTFIEKSLKDEPLIQPENDLDEGAKNGVKIIAVYSPIGGSGKSLASFALGKKLKKLEETAILLGCDDLQSIGVYMENRQHAEESLASSLKNLNEDTYWEVLKNVSQEEVPCLLPFEKPLSVLKIGAEELLDLVNLIKSKGDFNYIILDLGCDMSEVTRTLVQISDLCIIITEPTVPACRKLEKLLMNQELFPAQKTLLISNQQRSDGIHLNPETLFGSFAGYDSIEEAMDDPLFYRLVLEIIDD